MASSLEWWGEFSKLDFIDNEEQWKKDYIKALEYLERWYEDPSLKWSDYYNEFDDGMED